jgi:hypothetical protein
VAAAAADHHAADRAAEATAWAAKWSAWYAQYVARAAEQSERTGRLYHGVADAMSRGSLAPNALQDMLAAFYQARGSAYSERLAELTMRFFSRLVETAAAYSKEMTEAVMPGVPAAPPLPKLDPSDANAWFSQLTEYSHSLSAHITTSYKAFLDRVAAGQIATDRLKTAGSEYFERRFPEYLQQLAQLYFDLLSDLNDLRAAGEQDFLSGTLATAARANANTAVSLALTGPPGGVAAATLSIANTRAQAATIRYRFTEVRRADGIGPSFAPRFSVTPEHLELASSEEASFTLALALDEADYAPNMLYVGVLHITGHGEPPFEVPLRITLVPSAPASGDQYA